MECCKLRGRANITSSAITPEQSKAARALLKWSPADLAREAGVDERVVETFERSRNPRSRTFRESAAVIENTLAGAGIKLMRGHDGSVGVQLVKRKKKQPVSLPLLLREWDAWVTRNIFRTKTPTAWHLKSFVAVLKRRRSALLGAAGPDIVHSIETLLKRHRRIGG